MPFLLVENGSGTSARTDLLTSLRRLSLPSRSRITDRFFHTDANTTAHCAESSRSLSLGVWAPSISCRLRIHPEQTLWVAFDGYLTQRPTELRRYRPDANGAHSIDDAEFVARWLAEHGTSALDQLHGCFTLCAVWPERRTWLLQRDPLGGRTSYFWLNGDRRAASSSAAAIAALPAYRRSDDTAYIGSMFALRQPPIGHSPFQDIEELQHGHRLIASDHGVTHEQPAISIPRPSHSTPAQALERFSASFETAVESCLGERGDVAIMLSGGMDSTPIAAVASTILATQGRRLQPISWRLPSFEDADETRWIQACCEHLNLKPVLFDGTPLLPFQQLNIEQGTPELPQFNAFHDLVTTCYQLATENGCPIILNGNAGDLLYPPQRLLLIELARQRRWRTIASILIDLFARLGPKAALAHPILRYPAARAMGLHRRPPRSPAWLTSFASSQLPSPDSWPEAFEQHPWPEYAWQLMGPTMAFGRAHENVLANQHGVDRRDPFHNEALARVLLELPVELNLRRGLDKRIMRAAMRDRLPDSIRLKTRTGRLNTVLRAGYERNRSRLRLILDQHTQWQQYVRPGVVSRILSNPATNDQDILLIGQCFGYVRWLRWWQQH